MPALDRLFASSGTLPLAAALVACLAANPPTPGLVDADVSATVTTQDDSLDPADTAPGDDIADTAPAPCIFCPCERNDDCSSHLCLPGADGLECVRTCDEVCPSDYTCVMYMVSVDPLFICLYAHLAYCRPCDVDSDCRPDPSDQFLFVGDGLEASCIDFPAGQGKRCTTACGGDNCPHGAACQPMPDDAPFRYGCLPESGTCPRGRAGVCGASVVDAARSPTAPSRRGLARGRRGRLSFGPGATRRPRARAGCRPSAATPVVEMPREERDPGLTDVGGRFTAQL